MSHYVGFVLRALQWYFTFGTSMTLGLKAIKSSREVLGLLLPDIQKYLHTTLEFLDNTGTISAP